jgi:hypothetical protein
VGRKYTFLVAIMVMGAATFLVRLLPPSVRTPFPGSARWRASDGWPNVLTVTVDPATCQLNAPWNIPTPCDAARDTLTKAGLSFATEEGARGSLPVLKIEGPSGTRTIESDGGGGWAAVNVRSGWQH